MARKRLRYAQNFLKRSDLVRFLLRKSGITKGDVVIEIGPGTGTITSQLCRRAGRVIAIEIDPVLVGYLRRRFSALSSKVTIIPGDFTQLDLPSGTYKIFANIPFNRTADIMRKLYGSRQYIDAYLVLQKEAAGKYAGIPQETEVSITAKPFYEFEIVHRFKRSDFEPKPAVDAVMLWISLRGHALVTSRDLYRAFVRRGFRSAKPNLRLAYKDLFSYSQWKRLSKDLAFDQDSSPSDLTFKQWLGLFEYFGKGVAKEKQLRLRC